MTVLQFPRRAAPAPPPRRRSPDLPDLACLQTAPLVCSSPVYQCARPVPQPWGRPREHRQHWWVGQTAAGVRVRIYWETADG
jgi:hypothetical protein